MDKRFDIEIKKDGVGSLNELIKGFAFDEYVDFSTRFSIIIEGKKLNRLGNLLMGTVRGLRDLSEGKNIAKFSEDYPGFKAEIKGNQTKISSLSENESDSVVISTREFIKNILSFAKRLFELLCATEEGALTYYNIVYEIIPKIEELYLDIPMSDEHKKSRLAIDSGISITKHYPLAKELIEYHAYISYNAEIQSDNVTQINIALSNDVNVLRKEIPEVVKKIRSENPDEIELPLDKDMKVILKKDSIYFEGNQYQDEKEIKLTEKRREALLSKLERFSEYLNYLYHWIVEKGETQ